MHLGNNPVWRDAALVHMGKLEEQREFYSGVLDDEWCYNNFVRIACSGSRLTEDRDCFDESVFANFCTAMIVCRLMQDRLSYSPGAICRFPSGLSASQSPVGHQGRKKISGDIARMSVSQVKQFWLGRTVESKKRP